jgi:hypothetical protein
MEMTLVKSLYSGDPDVIKKQVDLQAPIIGRKNLQVLFG